MEIAIRPAGERPHAAAAHVVPLAHEDLSARTAPCALPADEWAQIKAWIKRTRFAAHAGDHSHLLVKSGDALRDVILLGAGPRAECTPGVMRKLGGLLAVQARRLGLQRVGIHADSVHADSRTALWVRALATGLVEGSYTMGKDAPAAALKSAHFLIGANANRATIRHAAARGRTVGAAINEIRDLANQPGNDAPPRIVAQFARRLARHHGLACTVWGPAELKRQRCDAIRAVAQGSREPPCLIQLKYAGRNRKLRPLVVIGKTITFDTGGISLKPGKNMEWMKFDKSGGMAVLAFMSLVASTLKPDRPIIGMLAAAENMPGSQATRPGDVVRSRNGKTIEIVNTDAEGRLVLADALDVAKELNPAGIIDLATLTGAATVALGRPASALLGNHPGLRDSLQAAGEASGDRLWPLPLFPEYKRLIRSPFADMKNIGDGSAGTIVGGVFLQEFVPPQTPWAHLDLTSAWEERTTGHGPAGATIFGAALLAQWVDEGGMESLAT